MLREESVFFSLAPGRGSRARLWAALILTFSASAVQFRAAVARCDLDALFATFYRRGAAALSLSSECFYFVAEAALAMRGCAASEIRSRNTERALIRTRMSDGDFSMKLAGKLWPVDA